MRLPYAKFLLALIIAAATVPARADTLGEGWPFRRPLVFKQASSDLPGDNIAWAEFYGNGKQQPDWSDLRITAADRTIMPIKIMQMSKNDDLVRVAFATKSDGPYLAWWGNPNAAKPGKELEINRGMLLEVTTGVIGTKAAKEGVLVPGAIGVDRSLFFVPEFSFGYNPQGDDHNIQLHYSGHFKIDPPIKPQMVFAVGGIGTLAIDGKTVATERGGLKSTAKDPFPVDLAAGWHALDVIQNIANQPNIVVELAWQRPGENAYHTLPASIFAPVARAVPGNIENANGTPNIDMSIEGMAEGFVDPSYYVPRYSFEAQFPAAMKPTITWDFGDGQTTKDLKKVNHIFLMPGVYPVTLRLENGGNAAQVITTRLAVHDRLLEKFPRPPEDPAKAISAVLKDYDPARLSSDQALRGVLHFETAKENEEMIRWGEAFLRDKGDNTAGDGTLWEEVWTLSRMQVMRKQYASAAEMWRLAAGKASGWEMRAKMVRQYVMALCDNQDDSAAAMKEVKSWEGKIPDAEKHANSIIKAAEAYAAIAQADGKAAQAAVDRATELAPVVTIGGAGAATSAYNQKEIRQGVLARNIENYIRTKDFDTAWQGVEEWDLEFPGAIWEGFTRSLRVKIAAAEGRDAAAARMALALARANPDGFYAAELVFRALESFKKTGDVEKAQIAQDLLKSKYPESPYTRDLK